MFIDLTPVLICEYPRHFIFFAPLPQQREDTGQGKVLISLNHKFDFHEPVGSIATVSVWMETQEGG